MGFSIAGCAAFGLDRFPVPPRASTPNPIVNVYRTADDRHLSLVMLQSDRFWGELMEAVGRPDLVADPRFADSTLRAEHNQACIAVLERDSVVDAVDQLR